MEQLNKISVYLQYTQLERYITLYPIIKGSICLISASHWDDTLFTATYLTASALYSTGLSLNLLRRCYLTSFPLYIDHHPGISSQLGWYLPPFYMVYHPIIHLSYPPSWWYLIHLAILSHLSPWDMLTILWHPSLSRTCIKPDILSHSLSISLK